MRAVIHSLKKANSGVLVSLSVVSAVIITDLLTVVISLGVWGRVPVELLVMGTLAATVVPAILAPILIYLVKRAASLEDVNQELHREIAERKRAEEEARRRTANLAVVSELAIECAAASPETDLVALIAERMRAATNALAVSVSIYSPREQSLALRYLAVPGAILSTLNRIWGRNIIGLKITVSPDLVKRMLTEVVAVSEDLVETTFGAIPNSIATVMQKAAGAGRFTGLALNHGSELMGTALIVTRPGQPSPDTDLALALAHVAAVSLRRKKAEDALRQANWVVENSPVMFFRWKAVEGWPVELVSENVVQLGYTPQDFLTSSVSYTALVHPQDLDRVAREMQDYSASGVDRFQQEYRIITHDGKTRWVDARKVIERDAEAQVTHYQGIIIDITDRRHAAAEREELIAKLEIKNKELESFTYTVSHDLKSPLITVRGFLGYLERDALAGNVERMKADMARIVEATDKMQRLLTELLELSRIGRMMNPPQAVPVETIVREALELVRGRITQRGAQVKIASGLPTVYGDRARLVEVVQNLVDNGCKFMGDQAEPCIEIGQRGADVDGKPILFVRDNGIGIAPQHHERVFGLFNKLDAQTEGTGVGLALVLRIIVVHGGRIWVESEGDGKGATFCFTLPVPEADRPIDSAERGVEYV